jgi:hypothetical protein
MGNNDTGNNVMLKTPLCSVAAFALWIFVAGCSSMASRGPTPQLSLEEIGAVQARIAFDQTRSDSILQEKGLDESEWEEIHATTIENITKDRSGDAYRRYLRGAFAASEGRFGEYGRSLARAMESGNPLRNPPPIALADWVALRDAMEVARWSDGNPAAVLKAHNLTAYEWFVVSSWWHQRMSDAARTGEQTLVDEYASVARRSRQQAASKFSTDRARLATNP